MNDKNIEDSRFRSDIMFQTDVDNSQNVSLKNTFDSKFQNSSVQITPKSIHLNLDNPFNRSNNSFKSPKFLAKKSYLHHHQNRNLKTKPLEKTFYNPIIPKWEYISLSPHRRQNLPQIKSNFQKAKTKYLKYSHYPIKLTKKPKFPSILDNFYLSN
jgi:hypothetical protein